MNGAGGAKRRLFVAVPLPEQLFGFVREAQGMLPRLPGLRLMNESQFHVTLAFVGEVGEREARVAEAVVGSVPVDMGGEALLGGFLLLPSTSRARVVTLGITDEGGVFAGLFARIMDGLEGAGIMQREKRPFRPHLTVARLRNPGPVQPRFESGHAEFAVESVCLFESELKREGAVYTVLERTVFARSGGTRSGGQETV